MKNVLKILTDFKFVDNGFENIILAGHSSGGWQSLKIQSNNDNLIDGVLDFTQALEEQ